MTDMDKIDTELFDPTVEPGTEKAHRVVRSVLASVPLAGSVLNEIFMSILESPLSKRRNEWMHSVSLALNQLIDAHKVTIDSLQANQQFVDALIQATLIAQKTSQKGKLIALRNAVSNAAFLEPRAISKNAHFLRLLDRLDEWHLKLLDFYRDPNQYVDLQHEDNQKVSGVRLLAKAFSELAGEDGYATSMWFDLKHAGLLAPNSISELHIVPSGENRPLSSYGCMITPLAAEFLHFVSDSEGLAAEEVALSGVRVYL